MLRDGNGLQNAHAGVLLQAVPELRDLPGDRSREVQRVTKKKQARQ